MSLNCKIGMKTSPFVGNRLSVVLQIIIIYVVCLLTIASPAVTNPRSNKRQVYNYFIKNRQNNDNYNGKQNGTIEYDRPLIYRDLFLKPYSNGKSPPWNLTEVKSKNVFIRKNRMSNGIGVRRSFENANGMTRILTFPIKGKDRGILKDFDAQNPAADCLTGGLDAGVVDGALKIGIGVDLAPGCGAHTEQPPKLVPVPVYIPRPVAVPVGVPQPYPIDIPRPVAIRVPVPFPSMNMESLPMIGIEHQFSSDVMKRRRDCLFQNCGHLLNTTKAPTEQMMDKQYQDVTEKNQSVENTIFDRSKSIIYRSLRSKNQTN